GQTLPWGAPCTADVAACRQAPRLGACALHCQMRFPTAQATPAKVIALCAAALSVAAGGCLMQASYSVSVTTADGVALEVPLSSKLEVPQYAVDDFVEVKNFRFMPLNVESVRTMA